MFKTLALKLIKLTLYYIPPRHAVQYFVNVNRSLILLHVKYVVSSSSHIEIKHEFLNDALLQFYFYFSCDHIVD